MSEIVKMRCVECDRLVYATVGESVPICKCYEELLPRTVPSGMKQGKILTNKHVPQKWTVIEIRKIEEGF